MNAFTATQLNVIQLAENPSKLLQAWQQLKNQHEGPLPLFPREAAEQLGVTEAQLLASRCGVGVTRITADWRELIEQLPQLGKVKSQTRNAHAVHIHQGEYSNIDFESFGGKVGAVDGTLELRYFLYRWSSAFAVSDSMKDGNEVLSLQFFDKYGTAIQKIYLLPESNLETYHALIEKYKDSDQSTHQTIEPMPSKTITAPDSDIDVESLRQAWAALTHTHDFHPMLKKFKVARQQALRLAGQQWAEPVNISSVHRILKEVSEIKLPIMVFVGNNNALQIYSGKIDNVKSMYGWLNILDDGFHFHLLEEALSTATAWIVRKPTSEGLVRSLEIFAKDDDDDLMVTFFGKRRPGEVQNPKWAELAEGLLL